MAFFNSFSKFLTLRKLKSRPTLGPRRLTTATICVDLEWHEEINEDVADDYRAGVARLPRRLDLARIATGRGRAGWGERL